METKAPYALIGLFVLVMLVGLASFAVWLGQSGGRSSYDVYDIYFNAPVRGLQQAADVRLNGIKVGDVAQVSLDKNNYNRVLTRIRVISGTPIKEDAIAQLEMQGITGLSYVLITGGTAGAPFLRDVSDQYPPVIPSKPSEIEDVLEKGVEVIEAVEKTLVELQEIFNEDNTSSISTTLTNIKIISQRLREAEENQQGLVAMTNSIKKAMDGVSEVTGTLNRFTQSRGPDLAENTQKTLKTFNETLSTVNEAGKNLSVLLESMQKDFKGLATDGFEQTSITLESMHQLIQELQDMISGFENDPGAYLSGKTQPETVLPE